MPSCARISYFQSFHGLGLVVCFMVIADQMQEAVNGQMAEMMIKGLLLVIGFPARRLIGDGDVAEHGRYIIIDARYAGRQP